MNKRTKPTPRPIAVLQVEAAEMLGVSVDTIRRYVAAGELPVTRLGHSVRIRVAALEEFAQAHEEKRTPAQVRDADAIYTTRGRRVI